MKYLKLYEDNQETPTPKFKIGDEVMVTSDLIKHGHPYGIIEGDIVKIIDCWIYANNVITYKVDSPKIRKIKKGYDISGDYFAQFHFEYEWKVDSKKYNL